MEYKQHIFSLEDCHVKIRAIYVGLPFEKSKQVLLEQGFSIDNGNSTPIVYKGDIVVGGLK